MTYAAPRTSAALLVCALAFACSKEAPPAPPTPDATPPAATPQDSAPAPAPPQAGGPAQPSPESGAPRDQPFPRVLPVWVEMLGKEAGVPDPNDPWKCLDAPPVRGRDIGRCRDLLRLDGGGVTQRDTNEVVEIVRSVEPVLKSIWAETFSRTNRTFNPPRVDYYGIASRNSLEQLMKSSRCERPLENALYCPIENAIYYDAIFMATLRALVSAQTMTPGRYAVIAVAAHEMGHTASIAAGASRGDEQVEELIADCFAGATVKAFSDIEAGGSRTVQITRALMPLDEGRMAMYIVGQRSTSGGAHAGPEVRRAIFTAGFNKGVGVCAPDAFR